MIDRRRIEEGRAEAQRLLIRRWRAKAKELRTIADGMKDEGTRRLLRNAAANTIAWRTTPKSAKDRRTLLSLQFPRHMFGDTL